MSKNLCMKKYLLITIIFIYICEYLWIIHNDKPVGRYLQNLYRIYEKKMVQKGLVKLIFVCVQKFEILFYKIHTLRELMANYQKRNGQLSSSLQSIG